MIDLLPFEPHPLLWNAHLQTVAGRYLPAPENLARTKVHTVKLADGDRLALCENKPNRKAAVPRVVLLMHGLAGHASSSYMLRIAEALFRRGWHVFRMNHRGCGEGRGLARNLYHAGSSADLSAVFAHIAGLCDNAPSIVVGFSLSGNILLTWLSQQKEPIPASLKGAIAVNPPIDLALCSDALGKPINRIYDLRFMLKLRKSIRERESAFPDFPRFPNLGRTLRDFDAICTAPTCGFESVDDYYARCSSKQYLARLTQPTWILAAADDPFVPKHTFDTLPKSDSLQFHMTKAGGHMGFIAAKSTPLGNRKWLEYAVITRAEAMLTSL